MVAGSPCYRLLEDLSNGMLLDNTIHALFDNYNVSINPGGNYKIVCFDGEGLNVRGRYLD